VGSDNDLARIVRNPEVGLLCGDFAEIDSESYLTPMDP
jgi:hypothetical protein